MIGLVGRRDSKELSCLTQHFQESEYTLIDAASFPENSTCTVSIPPTSSDIKSYYVQSTYSSPVILVGYSDDSSEEVNSRTVYKQYEKDAFLNGWLMAEQDNGKLVINTPRERELHHLKPYQLLKFHRAGLPVPESRITNDVHDARAFFCEYGKVITKPVGGLGFAEVQSKAEFEERADLLKRSPVLFQKYVPGSDIRAYVLDGKLIQAYEIESDVNKADYRGFETYFSRVSNQKIREIVEKAANCLEMRFCAVDLRLDSGTCWILDCNPSPGFAAIERELETTEISEKIADLLTQE